MTQMVLPVVSFAKARIDGICSSTAGANGSESFKYLFYISVPSLKKRLIVLFDVVFLLLNACMVLGGMSHFPRHLEEAVLFGHLKNMGPVVAWALGGGSATSGLTHIYWRICIELDHLTLRFMGAHYCMQVSISSRGCSSHLILLDL